MLEKTPSVISKRRFAWTQIIEQRFCSFLKLGEKTRAGFRARDNKRRSFDVIINEKTEVFPKKKG